MTNISMQGISVVFLKLCALSFQEPHTVVTGMEQDPTFYITF